jgi:PqqA peptide cyclase
MTARPYVLVAELTYRCPLRCAYCSNPTDGASGELLPTMDWLRVLDEANDLGIVQVHFTGGEPLLHADLEQLVARAREHRLYTNLITSGLPLARERLVALQALGLDALQLSFQSARADSSRAIAGVDAFAWKQKVADWARELGLPITMNVVLHRHNLDEVGQMIALAEELGAERLELANTQYLGWAYLNRDSLMPSATQLDAARAVARDARERLRGKMEILFVLPDYHANRPRACMSGWGERYIVITPRGVALPCQAANILPLEFPDVRTHSLDEIWNRSDAFQRYRGVEFLGDPCRTCERRALDFGGCRCQAFLLTGDATASDPACSLAPRHDLVVNARTAAHAQPPPLKLRHLPLAR